MKKDDTSFQNLLGILDGLSWFNSTPLNFLLEIITTF